MKVLGMAHFPADVPPRVFSILRDPRTTSVRTKVTTMSVLLVRVQGQGKERSDTSSVVRLYTIVYDDDLRLELSSYVPLASRERPPTLNTPWMGVITTVSTVVAIALVGSTCMGSSCGLGVSDVSQYVQWERTAESGVLRRRKGSGPVRTEGGGS